jgi:hypothetical protein
MSPDVDITVGDREVDPFRGGLLFLLLGLALTGYGGYDYLQQQQRIDTAERVDAAVIETGVEADSQGSSTSVDYYPSVRFEYTYRGETYTSDNVFPSTVRASYDTESAARDAIDEYDPDSTVTAYVPPDSPGDAFLENEQSNAPFIAVGIGLFAVLAGGWSVTNAYRRR